MVDIAMEMKLLFKRNWEELEKLMKATNEASWIAKESSIVAITHHKIYNFGSLKG